MTHYQTTPETIATLKALGSTITTQSGDEWVYLPHWCKITGPDTMDVVSFEHLPDDLRGAIKEMREEK